MSSNLNLFFSNFNSVFFWSSGPNGENFTISSNVFYILGYTAQEISALPNNIYSLCNTQDTNLINKKFIEAKRSLEPTASFLYNVKAKDSSVVWIKEEISFKRDKIGKIKSISAVCTDITEIKQEEEKNKSSLDTLKDLNITKDKFISILSHDLRAPFTSILGFSEILMSESSLSEPEKKEYLSYIHESSQNQLQLINYLLDWSRLQTGRLKLDPIRLNVQTLIYNCISALTGNAIRKNLEIKTLISPSLHILADERLISQVITNIISNAIKFSDENKTIEISAEIFDNKKIEFIIKDEGIGIPENNKVKLFKIEKMFSTEGTKGEKGTGLGLSLVKEIVEKHNGDIWFYSEAGKGSEFHFTIPASRNTILLVNDNKTEINQFEKIIQKELPSYEILTADNGFEAINFFLNKLPSLIITNHEMPLMNGLQFIDSLRREEKNLKIPIIALVNLATEDLKKSYLSYGVKSLLEKPVTTPIFTQKLLSALN
jgi:two-component system, sensor histidine kinase and response regulator